jgi:signal transduction histidine kinase
MYKVQIVIIAQLCNLLLYVPATAQQTFTDSIRIYRELEVIEKKLCNWSFITSEKKLRLLCQQSRGLLFTEGQVQSLLLLGSIELLKGCPLQAEKHFAHAQQLCKPGTATALRLQMLMGWTERLRGNYDTAAIILYDALHKTIGKQYPAIAAKIYIQLSQVQTALGNTAAAESLCNKGLRLAINCNDTLLQVVFFLLYANKAITDNNDNRAMQYLRRSEHLLSLAPSLLHLAQVYNSIARLKTKAAAYAAAEKYFTRSVQIAAQIGDLRGEAVAYNNLGDLYAQQYAGAAAIAAFTKSYNRAQQTGAPEIKQVAAYNLYVLHEAQKNTGDALHYFKEYVAIKDSLDGVNSSSKVLALDKKYRLSEKKIMMLNQQARLQALETKQKTRQRNLLMGSAAIFLLLAGLYARGYYQKRKLSRRIVAQNKELEALGQLKDQLFLVIGHDLRMPVAALGNITQTINYCIAGNRLQELQQMGHAIDESIQQITLLLDNVLTWALHQTHQLAYNPQRLQLRTMATQAAEALHVLVQKQRLQLQNNIADDIYVFADSNALKVVLRNLLHNAIKHTPGGCVSIGTADNGNEYAITISDDGPGIRPELMDRLQQQHAQPGKGTGLGLYLARRMTELNKGRLWLDSRPGSGTVAGFTLQRAQ